MSRYITLAEAASYLDVSKATLRNWDRAGKLRAVRHPINRYRVYDFDDLRRLRPQLSLLENGPATVGDVEKPLDLRATKKLISRLHAIMRDEDGGSNIIERFDELTKILFTKLAAEQDDRGDAFLYHEEESDAQYVARLRKLHETYAKKNDKFVPAAFSKIKCTDSALRECGLALSAVSFGSAAFDVKGLAYEEIIRSTFDKGDHQQFFTPPAIVQFIVDFVRPYIKGDVCDPAAGTGGFLVEVAKNAPGYKSLTAIEIDQRLAWVSGINLFLHGSANIAAHHVPGAGTLGKAAEQFFGRFDVIVTNPPFGSDFSDAAELPKFKLGVGKTSRRRGILFLERCFHLLKDNGVVAIILDEGVLNLPSTEDVRFFILESFRILGIVGLPEAAFMPYANVNASILFLQKAKRPKAGELVFYAKPENVGRKPNGDEDIVYDAVGGARLNSDFPEILSLWEQVQRGGQIVTSDLAYTANVRENLRADDNGLRLDFRYHHPSRHLSQEQLSRSTRPLLSLADLCDERNVTTVPASELQDAVILYTGLTHIESWTGLAHQVATPANSLKSAVKRYEPGDILFARMRPNLRKVALVSFPEGGYASPECIVLTVRKNEQDEPLIEPSILAAVLRSDLVYGQIMHLIAGIGRPRLSVTDLRRVLVPLPPPQVQSEARAEYLGQLDAVQRMRARAQELLKQAHDGELASVESLASRLIGAS